MNNPGSRTINFAGRAANSPQFDALYSEGMTLVETAAAYLDGPGRGASRLLSPKAASLYAEQSIGLTTRLMQLASWLLLQRSFNTGEMTREQVMQERRKLRFGADENKTVKNTAWNEMPPSFCAIVEQTSRLEARISKLDTSLVQDNQAHPQAPAPNHVMAQIDLLQTAFGRR